MLQPLNLGIILFASALKLLKILLKQMIFYTFPQGTIIINSITR